MVTFNPQHKAVLDSLLLDFPGIRPGKMFGFPAYYAGKKLCICLYENGVGLKLPEATVKQLLLHDSHTTPFQPLGKTVMREWIQIDLENSEEYRKYFEIFAESIRFVLSRQ